MSTSSNISATVTGLKVLGDGNVSVSLKATSDNTEITVTTSAAVADTLKLGRPALVEVTDGVYSVRSADAPTTKKAKGHSPDFLQPSL